MSTRFTRRGIPMPDSESLRLVFLTAEAHGAMTEYVARALRERGYEGISPSLLEFLGALECGVNYGSEIARALQVSRQMVAKTVKELVRAGYLEQVDGVGKQKQILFTEAGERLMSDVRAALASLDDALAASLPAAALRDAMTGLERIQGVIASRLVEP